ncbi:MAG TPA: DUF3667 domain-containing protein [Flavisolibacter sp.]|nr:DUF3667 domain-containing protein [Flavisolibacter sp.]
MSHQPERAEKDCLNCGTIVQGKYCHECGQENIVTHQSFGALTKHFIFDIFHFDGKFFDTLKYLLFRPGKIVSEYLNGKRASYLDPIRMYLFTSAVFFIIFFSFVNSSTSFFNNTGDLMLSKAERLSFVNQLHRAENRSDSVVIKQIDYLLDTTYAIYLEDDFESDEVNDSSFAITFSGKRFLMKPRQNKDDIKIGSGSGWAEKRIEKKWKDYKRKHADDLNAVLADFSNLIVHRFPYLLFLSLPFFAWILKLLYVRKNIYYSEHAVFTLYHYIFSFIILLFGFGIKALYDWLGWGILQTLMVILFGVWCFHLLNAMKYFYKQGWVKTVIKFLLLNLLACIIMLLLFIGLIFFSVFQL